ncbi:S1 family peptidase [Epibacterium sp. DP7N7-1]|nr:S1 family peptidase [Epibacterium sp. DP7N7-1]
MELRTHARLLDMARMTVLAAALIAPNVAAADVGMAPAPAVLSEAARDQAYDTIWENMRIAVGDQGRRAPELWQDDGATKADDKSVVYLLSFYDDGSFISGSGTIIIGDDGQGRVLTAGHVAPLERMNDGIETALQDIVAFSTDGRMLASLYPKLTGYNGFRVPDINALSALDISSDVAVLEVSYFADPDFEQDWMAGAVRIAREQPASIIAISAGAESAITNPGVSGASLRNGDGEVIGILSYVYNPSDAPMAASGSVYLSQLSSGFTADFLDQRITDAVDILIDEVADPDRPGRREGGIGIGAPVIQADVLRALHAGSVMVTSKVDHFHARLTGFPDHEMRSANIIGTGLKAYAASDTLDAASFTEWEWSPLTVMLDPISFSVEDGH